MSIKNLFTNNAKKDQKVKVTELDTEEIIIDNLVVNNSEIESLTIQTLDCNLLDSQTYGIYFENFPAIPFNTGEVTVQAPCGYVQFNNVPNFTQGSGFEFTVYYAPLIAEQDCVLISGIQLGSSENAKLGVDIQGIGNGQFVVIFFNFSTSTFTNNQLAFNYLILKGNLA